MQFYEINICRLIIFKKYFVYKKHEMIKNWQSNLIQFENIIACAQNFFYRVFINPKEKEKKQNIPISYNANYHTERKLERIKADYCLLKFDVLKLFLGIRFRGL